MGKCMSTGVHVLVYIALLKLQHVVLFHGI
jgi:hypothetical protein